MQLSHTHNTICAHIKQEELDAAHAAAAAIERAAMDRRDKAVQIEAELVKAQSALREVTARARKAEEDKHVRKYR